MKVLIVFGLFLFLLHDTYAQEPYTLQIRYPNEEQNQWFSFPDTLRRNRLAESKLNRLRQQGFELAHLNRYTSDTMLLVSGPKLYWKELRLIRRVNEESQQLPITVSGLYRAGDWKRIQTELLNEEIANGFPMAELRISAMHWQGDSLSAEMEILPAERFLLDSIVVIGNSKLKPSFLYRYWGMRPQQTFKLQTVDQARFSLAALGMVQMYQEPELEYSSGKVRLRLFLDDYRNSSFNFIAGLQPARNKNEPWVITADLNLQLRNLLGQAESVSMQWQRLQARSQKLQLKLDYPSLPAIPIGPSLDLNITKRDTFYIQTSMNASLFWLNSGKGRYGFFYNFESSDLLTLDTTAIRQNRKLPDKLDFRSHLYGISLRWQSLNNLSFPSRGIQLESSASAGSRHLRSNPLLSSMAIQSDGFSISNLFDSLNKKQLIFKGKFELQNFIPLAPRWVLHNRLKAEALIAKNILTNEKFRIGGFSLLRGFNEESVSSAYYAVLTAEVRYRMNHESYVYLFSDMAAVESPADPLQIDWPFSFGTGLALDSRAGWFRIEWSVGDREGLPMQFKTSKLHFGYSSYF